ncbi:CapA family protein [Mesonia ostreae]|uniref:CapA family protein n=1 Tax=Mesonia ostreae TaxID=861110 RepID=A0ABU2KH52_9FLAO|nr:CapA family protein [Mesonia ostreae]MDT0294043.1 CapA family protein [Mesonia ostreae]
MNSTSILITGDFAPQGRVLESIQKEKAQGIFNDFQDYLCSSDINITNLECPLVSKAEKIQKTGPYLKAPVESINILKEGKFDIVTLANNHILDYGFDGLKTTIETCKKNGIKTVGGGLSKNEVSKPLILIKNQKKIGLINIAEEEFSVVSTGDYGANPFDISVVYKTITDLKGKVDVIIVIAHGGHEFYKYPSPEIVKRYRLLIEFGVDAVVGHHPHCHSGFEKYNNGLIFYSLGNFSFDWPEMKKSGWNDGYAVKLNIEQDNSINYEIIPYKQGDTEPGVRLLKAEEKKRFLKELNKINDVIQSEELLMNEWQKFVDFNIDQYLTLIQPTSRIVKAFQNRKILPKIFFTKERNRLLLLNLIRCESHREMLTNVLKNYGDKSTKKTGL